METEDVNDAILKIFPLYKVAIGIQAYQQCADEKMKEMLLQEIRKDYLAYHERKHNVEGGENNG